MSDNIDKIIKFITTNKSITTTSEIMAEFPDLNPDILNTPEITKALENNKIKMQSALKIKLFKSNTTQSLLELNKILDSENNNDKTSKFINNLTERWYTNELQ